jgi:hypothetical protein
MRHLGVSLARLGGRGDEEPIRIVRQLGDKPPLLIRKFRTKRPPSCRLTVLAHGRKPEREHPAQRLLGGRIACEEAMRALSEHPAELKSCRVQAQHTVATPNHIRPHIVEGVG